MGQSKKIFFISIATLFGSIIFSNFAFDKFIAYGIKDQTSLRKRNQIRDVYTKIPFPITTKFYFFNITNPMEVTNGKKPILKEIGPYTYDTWITKTNLEDDDATDTLEYNDLNWFVYNPEATPKHLSHDDYVTILNPLMAGAVTFVANAQPAALTFVGKALDALLSKPDTMYMKLKVREILFDGIPINCSVNDFAAKIACVQMKSQLPGIVDAGNGILKFSVFGPRNHTIGPRIKVRRGIKNYKDVGKVVSYKGMQKLDLWPKESCNLFKGTDGWVFTAYLNRTEGLWVYAGDFCRSMQAEFVKDEIFKGLPVDIFEVDLFNVEKYPSHICYCEKENKCMPRGTYDLMKCMGAPLVATLPHFYKADPSLLKQVEGLSPSFENHSLSLYMEMITGSPLKAFRRVQFNIMLKPYPQIKPMANIPEVLHPILWVEDSAIIPDEFVGKISNLYLVMNINKYVPWFFIILSLFGMGYSGFLYYEKKTGKEPSTINNAIKKALGRQNSVNITGHKDGQRGNTYVNKAFKKDEDDNKPKTLGSVY